MVFSRIECQHDSVLSCQHEIEIFWDGYVNMEKNLMFDLMAASKRKDPDYLQVSGYVPKPLALRFKGFCTMQELEISEVLAELIEGWVKNQESKVAGK